MYSDPKHRTFCFGSTAISCSFEDWMMRAIVKWTRVVWVSSNNVLQYTGVSLLVDHVLYLFFSSVYFTFHIQVRVRDVFIEDTNIHYVTSHRAFTRNHPQSFAYGSVRLWLRESFSAVALLRSRTFRSKTGAKQLAASTMRPEARI